jgi:hypothetical protein
MASKEKNSGILIKKRDRSLGVSFKKYLLCTLYEDEFIFSFTDDSCKSHIHV